MTALTKDRNTVERDNKIVSRPVAANAVIKAGSLVAMNAAGYLVSGSAVIGLRACGRAEEAVDNTGGADGALSCVVRRACFKWANSAGLPIAQSNVGQPCFIEDDQTVSATDNAGTRSPAGIIADVETDGVWVDTPDGQEELSAIGNLAFANVAASGGHVDQTIAVVGAAVNDAVDLGLPAAPTGGLVYMAFVSAAGVVTVRCTNTTAGILSEAAANYRVTVKK